MSGSASLLADAGHSLSDLLSDGLTMVASAVPQLERFVTEVCEVVLDEERDAGGNPAAVPALLKNWRMQLHERALLADMRDAVAEILGQRQGGAEDPELAGTTVAVARAVGELVERESQYLALRARLADAERVLLSAPEDFFVKLVQHFQRLFCEPGAHVEGALPAMNRLYNTLAEMNTMMRWLRAVLGMGEDAGANAVAKRLQAVFAATRDMRDEVMAAAGDGGGAVKG